ncbi:eukaryotic translation initiation factor 3, subunit 3 gamma, isoform CRA_h [Rattus norvegicus]|uniref:Eukaryotic translation initiation factor 3, subunit 3 gamma, isoform CRA_h n=1 Tax=Rattus norvegicus TaxID=10116 RepID=A6HRE0_RAT|nr:eukaryotic translation initiation factor 3, subunit 3 gamma, isoform CRA_h [Rattus norvegicus]
MLISPLRKMSACLFDCSISSVASRRICSGRVEASPRSLRRTSPNSSSPTKPLPGWTRCSLQARLTLTARTSRSSLPKT